jgi:hypothetical protein
MNQSISAENGAIGTLPRVIRYFFDKLLHAWMNRPSQSNDRNWHYDVDGVSFESDKGVIVAGSAKSGSGKRLEIAIVRK